MSRERRAVEHALRRRAGASRAHAEKVFQHHFAEQADLHTTCPRCGARRRGTLEELKQPHGCGDG